MEEIVVRYVHFIGIILLSSMLVTQNIIISKRIKNDTIKKLAVIDGLYGFGAVLTLTAGLLLWFYVGKPAGFYSNNFIFHTKLTVFIFVALISILPTIFLVKRRKSVLSEIDVPIYIIVIKRVELVLILVIPLLAVLMSRGIGYL